MIEIAAERLPAASLLFAAASVYTENLRLSRKACDAASVSVETIMLMKSGQRKCFSGRREVLMDGLSL